MLATPITITVSGGGPGTYTCNALFSDASKAKFVAVGDTVEDRLGNKYEITTWGTFPADFASGGTLTVDFITIDIAPATFAGFGDGSIYTPDQVDVRPAFRTAGFVSTQVVNSGQDYKYDITAIWYDVAEAAQAVIGDYFIDSNGKLFEITAITGANFTSGTVQEVHPEGVNPVLGEGSIFPPSANYGYYQGTELTDPARTYVFNRDKFLIDEKLKEIEDTTGSGLSVEFPLENNTGGTLVKGIPVRIDSNGDVADIDPSAEIEALATAGIVRADILNGEVGNIVQSGRLIDITTSGTFDDVLYVSKAGGTTNVAPEIGVGGFIAGDFVISLGVIAKNQSNPLNKDLLIRINVVGQL